MDTEKYQHETYKLWLLNSVMAKE